MRNFIILKKAISLVFVLTISIFQTTNIAVAGTQILDNGQAGTSFNGTWKPSGAANSYGSQSVFSGANGASYTYKINLATPGAYQVYARWTEWGNRRTRVPYDIIHKTGTNTINVNQQQNGGTWQRLGGTWTFGNQATIRIRSLGNGTTSADAIKLVYVGNNTTSTAPATPAASSSNIAIQDNGQAGTSFSGSWKASGAANSYGSQSVFSGANGSSYTFKINLATPGAYQVYARWTEWGNRRTSVPYDIIHKTGTNTVNVNQRQNGGTWQKLGGNWTFGNQATIRIRSLGNGTTSADAIKLVYVGSNTTSTGTANTGSMLLRWTAPVARADGSALSLSEISGYTVYYGTTAGNFPNSFDINDASATSVNITDLRLGTYYLYVTTTDTAGRESGRSSVATKLVK